MTRLNRRDLIASSLALGMSAWTTSKASAQGKGAGGGNGKGGGKGNSGTGNGGGKGNGKGGSSNAGGNGKGNGGAKASDMSKSDDGSPATQGARQRDALKRESIKSSSRPGFRVRHKNGFEEAINSGRYTMKDNRGRTIVNRIASSTDYARLRRLAGS